MTTRSTLAKTALGAAAIATAFAGLLPAAASAQPRAYDQYGDGSGYYYDGCRRAQSSNATGAGLLGAVAGAVIGGNVASRNARDEGAVLGGLLGAAVGASIGKNAAACRSDGYTSYQPAYQQPQVYYSQSYYSRPYAYYGQGYGPAYSYAPQPAYDDYGYDYDAYDRARRPADDGCRNVESSVRMPDGRVQTRLVRACPDSRGQYQIVD